MIYQTILLTILTFIAAVVGTISGFGISTIMIPVMLLFYPLPTVLLFVAIIHLSGDYMENYFFQKRIKLEIDRCVRNIWNYHELLRCLHHLNHIFHLFKKTIGWISNCLHNISFHKTKVENPQNKSNLHHRRIIVWFLRWNLRSRRLHTRSFSIRI